MNVSTFTKPGPKGLILRLRRRRQVHHREVGAQLSFNIDTPKESRCDHHECSRYGFWFLEEHLASVNVIVSNIKYIIIIIVSVIQLCLKSLEREQLSLLVDRIAAELEFIELVSNLSIVTRVPSQLHDGLMIEVHSNVLGHHQRDSVPQLLHIGQVDGLSSGWSVLGGQYSELHRQLGELGGADAGWELKTSSDSAVHHKHVVHHGDLIGLDAVLVEVEQELAVDRTPLVAQVHVRLAAQVVAQTAQQLQDFVDDSFAVHLRVEVGEEGELSAHARQQAVEVEEGFHGAGRRIVIEK